VGVAATEGTATRTRRDSPGRRLRRLPAFRRAKLFLKRLVGREPWLALEAGISIDRFGDWALDTGRLRPGDVVYAVGVGKDLSVEAELVRRHGVRVHAFDPSPESLRWVAGQALPDGLEFHALGIAEHDGRLTLRAREAESGGAPVMYSAVDTTRTGPAVEVECLSLASAARRLGHARIALLKLDVEGAEYGALRSMLAGDLRPGQILVEFHHRFPGLGKAHTERAVADLRAAGYRLACIADTGREFTFVRD